MDRRPLHVRVRELAEEHGRIATRTMTERFFGQLTPGVSTEMAEEKIADATNAFITLHEAADALAKDRRWR